MSERNVARQGIQLQGRQRRGFEERLLVRVPALARLGGRVFMRLKPGSRLRRRLAARRARQIYDALNRGDQELFLSLASDPEIEIYSAKGEQGGPVADLQDVYRGRLALLAFLDQWGQAWEDISYEPEQLIDCGRHLCVLLRIRGRGRVSGVEVDSAFAQLVTMRDGVPVRIENFWDHREAMQAAGLSE